MNTRRFHRKQVFGTRVKLTDGSNCLTGLVSNVSNTGIEVVLENELVDPYAAKYTRYHAHDEQACRSTVIPRWQKGDCEGNGAGMLICEAPRNWFCFVDSLPRSAPGKIG